MPVETRRRSATRVAPAKTALSAVRHRNSPEITRDDRVAERQPLHFVKTGPLKFAAPPGAH